MPAEKLLVITEDSGVNVQPFQVDGSTEVVPCTFRNATDRTVYLWHWIGPHTFHDGPCLVRPMAIGKSLTMYYPKTFFVRATFDYDFHSTVLDETTVGDIPRHVVLLSESRHELAV